MNLHKHYLGRISFENTKFEFILMYFEFKTVSVTEFKLFYTYQTRRGIQA